MSKKYKEHDAVKDLSLQVDEGECVALLGPNGAGKSTTIEILEGFRSPSSGSAMVLGENPKSASRQWRDRIGVVLQSAFSASSLTVIEELKLASIAYSNPYPVGDVIDMVGLQGKAKQQVAKLSGGQRRRLDVALGIIGRPKLLFLDEPTTGFDPTARIAFLDVIDGLRQSGTTILLTTHYMEEANHLADRILVMNEGELVATGSPDQIGDRTPIVQWIDPFSGEQCFERTQTPTEFVVALANSLNEIPGLQVIVPSLEQAYLSIINGERVPA